MRVERILWRKWRAKNMTCETPLKQWVTLPGCDVSGMSRELCLRRGEECVEETSVESETERPREEAKRCSVLVYYSTFKSKITFILQCCRFLTKLQKYPYYYTFSLFIFKILLLIIYIIHKYKIFNRKWWSVVYWCMCLIYFIYKSSNKNSEVKYII